MLCVHLESYDLHFGMEHWIEPKTGTHFLQMAKRWPLLTMLCKKRIDQITLKLAGS
jgi:hypothetical protein